MGDIIIKIENKKIKVKVLDKEKCGDYACFVPHDCPVQGAGGVRSSEPRWMCLTNFLHGCPDEPKMRQNKPSWTIVKK